MIHVTDYQDRTLCPRSRLSCRYDRGLSTCGDGSVSSTDRWEMSVEDWGRRSHAPYHEMTL